MQCSSGMGKHATTRLKMRETMLVAAKPGTLVNVPQYVEHQD